MVLNISPNSIAEGKMCILKTLSCNRQNIMICILNCYQKLFIVRLDL